MGLFNFRLTNNAINTEFLRTKFIEFHPGLTQNGKYNKEIDIEDRNINGEKYIVTRKALPQDKLSQPIVKELRIWPESDCSKKNKCIAITNNLESLICTITIDFNRLDKDEKYIDELFNQFEDMIFRNKNIYKENQLNQQGEHSIQKH